MPDVPEMPEGATWHEGAEGVAAFDQLKAEAVEQLRGAHGFMLVAVTRTGQDREDAEVMGATGFETSGVLRVNDMARFIHAVQQQTLTTAYGVQSAVEHAVPADADDEREAA